MTREFRDRRTALRLGAAALATLGTAGCLTGRPSSVRAVAMPDDRAFEPRTATIGVGETVTWTNESGVQHTVTAYGDGIPAGAAYFASGGFDSERAARNRIVEGLIDPGEAYAHTFEEPGTYEYYCVPHESSGMVGTIRVENR